MQYQTSSRNNNNDSSNKSLSTIVLSSALAMSGVATAFLCYKLFWLEPLRRKAIHKDWEKKRQEERTGRIRAEVKLRQALNRLKTLGYNNESSTITTSKTTSSADDDPHMLPLSTIGVVVSPYPKRMGTPRQGVLVPSSRGYIQFHTTTIAPEALDGIDSYSHLWIIFQFHENTSLATSKKSKIRPPRGGGIKVGQLSTRSPHRPNPLGLSLVTLDGWEPSTRRLHIRALDLVDGTPVYDVKPYVHWDIPREVPYDPTGLKLPKWVESKDDVLPSVIFTTESESSLQQLVQRDILRPLYPQKDPTSLGAARQTLKEILAQDPRSSHRGLSKNQRGTLSSSSSSSSSQASDNNNNKRHNNDDSDDIYRLLFAGVVVEFVVETNGAVVKSIVEASDGDNNDDNGSKIAVV